MATLKYCRNFQDSYCPIKCRDLILNLQYCTLYGPPKLLTFAVSNTEKNSKCRIVNWKL